MDSDATGLTLSPAVTAALYADVEYRLREIIHEAKKFMRHAKRTKMLADDVNFALKAKNVEPLHGFTAASSARFKSVMHGQQRLFFLEDQEVDLDGIIYGPLPPVPLEVNYTAHWLAIDGVQPAIVQNPSPADLKAAAAESLQLSQLRSVSATSIPSVVVSGSGGTLNNEPLVKHVLSKELQLYYDKITESVMSSSDEMRNLAVESISKDPGIQPLLPFFVLFITDKVTKHIRNLSVLWAMMRLTRAILQNGNLFVEPYLHHMIPNIVTCIVSKTIGEPGEDHFALRKFSSQLAAHISGKFGTTHPTLQPRITKTLLRAFLDPKKPISTHLGALAGLASLGHEAINLLVLPNLKSFGDTVLAPDRDEYGAFKSKDGQQCFDLVVEVVADCIKSTEEQEILETGALDSKFGIFASSILQYLKK